MSEIVKIIVTLVLGIVGPILCYIVVYGSTFLFSHIYLLIKAKKFRKRLAEAQANMDKDDFDEIEVEVVTSYNKEMEE